MSVGDKLGLESGSELLAQARRQWPSWATKDPRLSVVEEFDDLRPWLLTVTREEADSVLLALAMLAAPDGGDDIAAAAALAKCLLPGACRLAGWLSSLPPNEVLRDSQPSQSGAWWAVERIDEVVAAQLWIEIRTFPWRRLTKVASNIIVQTKVGVLREIGDHFQLKRVDRTWSRTDLVDVFTSESGGELDALRSKTLATVAGRPAEPSESGASPADELLDVLAWACERDVISETDRRLLLCLVREADSVRTRNLGRGYGGLLGNELSVRVAPKVGVSQATVRRNASRSVRALAAAAGQYHHAQEARGA